MCYSVILLIILVFGWERFKLGIAQGGFEFLSSGDPPASACTQLYLITLSMFYGLDFQFVYVSGLPVEDELVIFLLDLTLIWPLKADLMLGFQMSTFVGILGFGQFRGIFQTVGINIARLI